MTIEALSWLTDLHFTDSGGVYTGAEWVWDSEIGQWLRACRLDSYRSLPEMLRWDVVPFEWCDLNKIMETWWRWERILSPLK